jgi:hypothetical protein
MSTNLICFLFGIPATLLWVRGVTKGVTYGSNSRWVRRDDDPLRFWFFTLWWGDIALGLVVTPVLSWLGLRE